MIADINDMTHAAIASEVTTLWWDKNCASMLLLFF